jgi:DNA-binding transcriptional regulator YhcF (GntR family)
MIQRNFSQHIQVDDFSAVPKYLQISHSIISAVESGRIGRGEIMPSINDLSNELCVSRGTIEKGYKYLKTIKALSSYPGKGYYISDMEFRCTRKVCLLFNKLSEYKKLIYDAFIEALGPNAVVNLFIYNNDPDQFKALLNNNLGKYTHYVIIPHFVERADMAFEAINKIPKEKIILLDKIPDGIGDFAAVYENFEKDIYQVFNQAKPLLLKYHTLKLIFPENSYYPKEIRKGFIAFCRKYDFKYAVIDAVDNQDLQPGEVYINLMEDDLVALLEKVKLSGLKPGVDIGIISYNETPIKKFLLGGITTVSTDFKLLGSLAAQLVLDASKRQIAVPFHLTVRSSL